MTISKQTPVPMECPGTVATPSIPGPIAKGQRRAGLDPPLGVPVTCACQACRGGASRAAPRLHYFRPKWKSMVEPSFNVIVKKYVLPAL